MATAVPLWARRANSNEIPAPHRDLTSESRTMDGSSTVQTLIDQFELMAQANAAPTAPRTWSVTRCSKTALPPQPKSDNWPVKEIIERLNTQRGRTQSEPAQMTRKCEESVEVSVEPALEESLEEEAMPAAKPVTPTKPAVYRNLTVKTLRADDDDDKTINSYEDESDADSTTTTKSTCYSAIPPSPSSYSTASTGSLDSLLSSLDIFLPDLLQVSGEASSEVSKIVKPKVYHTRRSSLPDHLQSTATSKLIPPTSYRRASLTGRSASTAREQEAAPKSRRSSLYTSKNQAQVPSTPARPRRSSLSATIVPPAVKSMRRFSACGFSWREKPLELYVDPSVHGLRQLATLRGHEGAELGTPTPARGTQPQPRR
ncbi:unnamed protein product [Phytophthora lilii]|uniref:Unnamed protein product n=1 Tax=Phytophthora lilii TaxID=2077276 RepID=A0A9W6TEF1_9STRA|nr:unnamed protein product [Phytophthora lilii]